MSAQRPLPRAPGHTHFADVFFLVVSAQVAIYTEVSVLSLASDKSGAGAPLNFCLDTHPRSAFALAELQEGARHTGYWPAPC